MVSKHSPNIIMICIDTLRSDHMSGYGWHHQTTPNIDKIIEQGTMVTDMFSPYIPTHPGHTTMFTGRDAIAHQIVNQGSKIDLDASIPTLAEILSKEGYYTAAADNLGRWFDRGFSKYEGYEWEQEEKVWRKGEGVNKTVLPMLDEAANQTDPFFCFFHYWDPHTPYLPPAPFSGMFYEGDEKDTNNSSMHEVFNFEPFANYFREWMGEVTDRNFVNLQYDAEIAYADHCIGQVFDKIESLGLKDDTLLVVLADHGEELDEHGLWYDHHGLYDTNLRVPFILRFPGIVPAGSKVDGMVTLMDVAPTILDLVGLDNLIEEHSMDGFSVVPLMGTDKKSSREELFLIENSWQRKRGIRTNKWKYFEAIEHPDLHNRPPLELYDLENDPGEYHNIAEDNPDLIKEFHDRYVSWLDQRKEETGNRDPQEYQGITLTRVGSMSMAIPTDMKLDDGMDDDGKMKGYVREK